MINKKEGYTFALMQKRLLSLLYVIACLLTSTAFGQIRHTERQAEAEIPVGSVPSVFGQFLAQAKQYAAQGQGDRAIHTMLEALRISSRHDYAAGVDTALLYLDQYCQHWGIPDKQQAQILRLAITYSQSHKTKSIHRASLHNKLAIYYKQNGKYFNSLLEYERALRTIPGENIAQSASFRGMIYTNIASIWNTFEEYPKALNMLDKAEDIARQQRDTHLRIGILQKKGNIHSDLSHPDSAYYYLMESYNLVKTYTGRHNFACKCREYTVANLAFVLIQKRRPGDALLLIHAETNRLAQAYREQKQLGFSQKPVDALRAYYTYLQALAYFEKKEYKKTEQILLPLLQSVQDEKVEELEKNIQELLSTLYQATGRYEKAFLHKARFAELAYSNSRKEEKSNIIDLYYELEKEKAVSEKLTLIARQQAQIKEKNYLIIGSLTGAFLLALSLVALYRNHRNKNKLQAADLSNIRKQQEIHQLQARIEGEEQERSRIARELHDGIGSQLMAVKLSVNALQIKNTACIAPYELNDVALQLQEATGDLRRTSHNLTPDLLLQQVLVLSLATLCEKISKSTLPETHFLASGPIPPLARETELTIYRMAQELVQNVLKHANATQLLVQLGYVNELLSITVEDNGKGIPVTVLQGQTQGTGLRNLKRRVELLNGQLDIQSREGKNTTVYLEFHLKDLI